jgi:hypothetical protein
MSESKIEDCKTYDIEMPDLRTERKHDEKERRLTINIPRPPQTPKDDEVSWNFSCFRLPKECIVYFSQVSILSVVVAVSLYNLTTSNERLEFWSSLLSGSIGYLMPQPTMKKK